MLSAELNLPDERETRLLTNNWKISRTHGGFLSYFWKFTYFTNVWIAVYNLLNVSEIFFLVTGVFYAMLEATKPSGKQAKSK